MIQIIDDATGETIDTCTLADFLGANADDEDVCDAARALKPGESTLIGGGAAPLMRIECVADPAIALDAGDLRFLLGVLGPCKPAGIAAGPALRAKLQAQLDAILLASR